MNCSNDQKDKLRKSLVSKWHWFFYLIHIKYYKYRIFKLYLRITNYLKNSKSHLKRAV